MLLARHLSAAVSLVTAYAAYAQELPNALKQIELQRTQLRTGQIEWTRARFDQRRGENKTTYHSSRFAGDDLINVNRGDLEGVVVRMENGEAIRPEGLRPRHSLQKNIEMFYYNHGSIEAESFPTTGAGVAKTPDMRALGMARWPERQSISDSLWGAPGRSGARRYRETAEDGVRLVIEESDAGTRKWWIDPQRGWGPTRVVSIAPDGKTRSECRAELRQFGGVWFPSVVKYYQADFRGGNEPVESIEVTAAEFNAPDQPQSLTLTDIGIEPGVIITKYASPNAPLKDVYWDGKNVISEEEFDTRVRAGDLAEGPNFKREVARLKAVEEEVRRTGKIPGGGLLVKNAAPNVVKAESGSNRISEWEAYTRAFIAKYRLNDEQAGRALAILHECQDQAFKVIASRSEQLAALDKRTEQAAGVEAAERDRMMRGIDQERAALLKPLDEMFDSELKPRLDGLPTRAQRQAAEAPAVEKKPVEPKP